MYLPIVARQRLSKYPLIFARKRIGKNPLIVARRRSGKYPLTVARQRLCNNPPIVARRRLGTIVAAITNTHGAIEEVLDASFSMRPCRIKESRRLLLPGTSSCCVVSFNARSHILY
jgi:hypothetical protein